MACQAARYSYTASGFLIRERSHGADIVLLNASVPSLFLGRPAMAFQTIHRDFGRIQANLTGWDGFSCL